MLPALIVRRSSPWCAFGRNISAWFTSKTSQIDGLTHR
jgi:hypothetical protein